jgi:hypothetical protein
MMIWLFIGAAAVVVGLLFFVIVRLSPTSRLDPHDRQLTEDAEARAQMTSFQGRSGSGFSGL